MTSNIDIQTIDRLKMRGIETLIKSNDSDFVRYAVYFIESAYIQSSKSQSHKNTDRILSELNSIINDENIVDNSESFSENVISNVKKFISLSISDDDLEGTALSPRQNGTFLLDFDTASFYGAVNIGEKDFSYSIINNSNNKSTNGMYEISNLKEITRFFDIVNKLKI